MTMLLRKQTKVFVEMELFLSLSLFDLYLFLQLGIRVGISNSTLFFHSKIEFKVKKMVF